MCLMVMMEKNVMVSSHYKKHRYKREKFINKYIHGDGCIVDGFIVDNGHERGPEVHSITDNGIIIIHNLNSGALISKLIARPQQIKRYYKMTSREPPKEYRRILELAKWHQSLGYNHV